MLLDCEAFRENTHSSGTKECASLTSTRRLFVRSRVHFDSCCCSITNAVHQDLTLQAKRNAFSCHLCKPISILITSTPATCLRLLFTLCNLVAATTESHIVVPNRTCGKDSNWPFTRIEAVHNNPQCLSRLQSPKQLCVGVREFFRKFFLLKSWKSATMAAVKVA